MPDVVTGKQSDQKLKQERDALLVKRDREKKLRIRIRSLLKEREPVAFEALNQALLNGKAARAYLFAGPESALKEGCALLLAQSLFLDAAELIDEAVLEGAEGSAALRVAEGNHTDFLLLDGTGRSKISLEEVQSVNQLFARTAMEKTGRKVYIIRSAENMTYAAMNGLLKFLEEPADGVYAILTTDHAEQLLPTVISRCVRIPFHAMAPDVCEEMALAEGLDEEDAYFLSELNPDIGGYGEAAGSAEYQNAKALFKSWLGIRADRQLFYVDYELRYGKLPKADTMDKVVMLRYFFRLCARFEKDSLQDRHKGPSWYDEAVRKEQKKSTALIVERLKIACEQRDRVNRNNDANLVMAQAMFRWEEAEYDSQ